MTTPVFFNPTQFPAVRSYYGIFPNEPIYDGSYIPINRQEPIVGMDLDDILQKILRSYSKSQHILIVSHGSTNGLALPWQKRSASGLMSAAMEEMIRNLKGESSDSETVKILGFVSEKKFRSFKENLIKVRKLNIKHVLFRSCDTGANPDTLLKLKFIFGSKIISAPKLKTVFGIINYGQPRSDLASWNLFIRNNPKAKIFGKRPNRFAYSSRIVNSQQIQFNAFAESHIGAKSWVETNMVKGNYQLGEIPYQGMIDPSTNSVIFSGQSSFKSQLGHI